MKKRNKESILIILFIAYITQGIILFLNNEKINTMNNNQETEIMQDIVYNKDLGESIREINNLGFNIESIEKEDNKISADIFINSSNNDITKSLENLKQFNYFIEDYTINKNHNVYVRIKVKIP